MAQSGVGIVDAIEAGWASMPGDLRYLAWLGDDDRLEPGSLAASLRALDRKPRAVMAFGRCRYIDFHGLEICEIRPGRVSVPLLRMGINMIAQPGAVYRRSTVEGIGGLDPDVKLAFDVDLHLRLSRAGRLLYLPLVLGEARSHSGSLTTNQRSRSLAEARYVTLRSLPPLARRTRHLWQFVGMCVARVAYRVSSRVSAVH